MRPVVLGGGIGGLSAAYYLLKLGRCGPADITLLEGSPRIGGWMRTVLNDGARFELGPRSIRPVGRPGANTLEMVQELGMSGRIVPVQQGHPAARNRLVYAHGKLHRLPNSLAALFKRSEPFKRPLAAALIRDIVAKRKLGEDDTIDAFVRRRFGDDVADYAFDPLVRGVCAGDSREVSVRLLLPKLYEAEQQYGMALIGSLLQPQEKVDNPKWSTWSFDCGLEMLPIILAEKLREVGVSIQTNTCCQSVDINRSGATLHTTCGDIHATHVLSCIPTHSLQISSHPALHFSIPYVTVAIACLEYPPNSIPEPAFGLLLPSSEPQPILGIVYDTCTFPQGNRTILTVMMGGAWFESHLGQDPTMEELTQIATKAVRDIVEIKADPVAVQVEVLRQCIPQYTLGHYQRVAKARKYIQDNSLPLALAGAAFDGISVNDVIYASRNAAMHI